MRRSRALPRRGIATFWVIVSAPALLMLLVFVTDIGNLWLARGELETALESAALAAAKQWGDSGGAETLAARQSGVDYAAANTVVGNPVLLSMNYNPQSMANENADQRGQLVFGSIRDLGPPLVFEAAAPPGAAAGSEPAVCAQATVAIPSLWQKLFGISLGPYQATARSTARYRSATGQVELVRVDDVQLTAP